MKTDIAERKAVGSFEILKEIEIAAPIGVAFEATMEQLGAECQMPGGKAFPMKIEAKPGGRWYRDLGNDAGHLWGHVYGQDARGTGEGIASLLFHGRAARATFIDDLFSPGAVD